MIGVKILIEGKKVQGVGYRIFLLRKAFESDIKNIYTRNIDADKVEVLVRDKEYKVNRLYEALEKREAKRSRRRKIEERAI